MNRHQRRAKIATSHGLLLPARHRAEFEGRQQENEMIHLLIAKRAKFLCGQAYDHIASRSNNFFAAWPNEQKFIETAWRDFIGPARNDLSKKLGNPLVSDEEKEIIYEAICLDRSLPKSQTRNVEPMRVEQIDPGILKAAKITLQ